MPSARRACLTILAAAGVATGCVGPVASGSPDGGLPSASAVARASATLNPNQLARQSQTPTPSPPSPSPSPPAAASATPIATRAPLSEMETALPLLVGGGGADPRPLDATQLFGESVDGVAAAQRLLETVGATAADFEGAASSCCSAGLDVFDIRIRGVPAATLADALAEAFGQVEPGSVSSSRTVDGVRVVRLRWSSTTPRDVHLVAIGDIVFGFAGVPERQGDVDATIGFLRRPRLDSLLPQTIGGRPTQRASLPASAVGTGGDICSFVCPGEPNALAAKVGVPIGQIDLAYAAATQAPGALVIAFRVPGVSNAKLISARIAARAPGVTPWGREDRRIGGKSVTWIAWDPFPNSSQNEYLYAHDHVLYSIRPPSDDGPPNAAVVEAIRALP